MTEETKTLVQSTKHQAWKWVGSLFLELKDDGSGKAVPAASLTRVLALILFISVNVYWWMWPADVPDLMVYTLWTLLGLRGVNAVADAIRGRPASP